MTLRVTVLDLDTPRQPLLGGVNFSVACGEVLTLMGASGSGKSSLLHWIAGALPAEMQARGAIWLGDKRIDTLPTEKRQAGILFQDPLLFPHLSAGQNLLVALPPGDRRQRRAKAESALEQAGLAGFFNRDPATLSGGQCSRISLLRALLAGPQLLLLDEPFARLDNTLRADFRQWVFAQVTRQGIPVVQVTHDRQDIPAGGRVLEIAQWSRPCVSAK